MFKVIDNPEFVEDVKVEVPDGDGWQSQILRTRFRALEVSEMDALEEAGGATAIIERAVVGFEELVDKDDKPLDGYGEWRSKLLGYAYVRAALIRTFYVAQSGLRVGNSGPSAAPGQGAS